MNPKNRHWILGVVLVLIALVLYWDVTLATFLWDDQQFVVENRYLASWTFIPKILFRNLTEGSASPVDNFYRPLQGMTHFLDMQIWGLDPLGHHLTNLLLFLGSLLLLFRLLRDLFKKADPINGDWIAFLITSVFCFHPLQTSAVAYVSGRGDLLVFSFSYLAASFFSKNIYLSALFCFAAMFFKENGVLASFFVLLFDYLNSSFEKKRVNLARHIPNFSLGLIYFFLRLTVFNFKDTLNFFSASNILTENYSYRVWTYFSTLAGGLRLMLWPVDIHHERHWLVYTTPEGLSLLGLVVSSMIVGGALYFRKRSAWITGGLFWIIWATVPTSNLLALINALFYDHWFVWPMFGVSLVFGSLIKYFFNSQNRFLAFVTWIILLIPLIYFSEEQKHVWANAESLYLHILKHEPASSKIMNNLGMLYSDQGKLEEAKEWYEKSLKIMETYQARVNLANLYGNQNPKKAEENFRKSIELEPKEYHAHFGLGQLLVLNGNCKDGLTEIETAEKLYIGDAGTSEIDPKIQHFAEVRRRIEEYCKAKSSLIKN